MFQFYPPLSSCKWSCRSPGLWAWETRERRQRSGSYLWWLSEPPLRRALHRPPSIPIKRRLDVPQFIFVLLFLSSEKPISMWSTLSDTTWHLFPICPQGPDMGFCIYLLIQLCCRWWLIANMMQSISLTKPNYLVLLNWMEIERPTCFVLVLHDY